MRRTVYLAVCITLSLYLGACASSGNNNGAPSQPAFPPAQTAELDSAGADSQTQEEEGAVRESLEQERLQREERRLELAASFEESLTLGKDSKERAAFVEWLLGAYDLEQLEKIDFSGDVGRQLYDVTGKSLHVLWDTSLGYLEDADTAAAHSIYLKESEGAAVDLAFAGDICLTEDGYVIDHYDAVGGDITQCLSKEIMDRLSEADISMINHEYPVSVRGTALAGKYYTFRASPEREMILEQMGIDIVSLANNHIYDFGADAFYDTLEALVREKLPYVGAGVDMEEASRPVYFVAGGIKIGFVSANRSERIIYTPEAGENSPGVVRMYDTAMMNEIIKEAGLQCDYLIAYVHWGTEDSKYYEAYQTDIAREFFDSGADAIIGSHPHVLQGIGYVDGKPVVYSLGDFWFNGETKYTTVATLKVTIDGLKELSVLPCIQEGYETHYIGGELEQGDFYRYLRELSPDILIDDAGVVTGR